MTNIRRQSIISSLVIYLGFAIGLLNTYFFTKQGLFTETEYGLTTIFMAIATMMMALATLAMPSFIFKFHPYYQDNLEPKKNDMITWALIVSTIGFLFVTIAGVVLKFLVIRKFGANAPQLVQYYYWVFPMGFGLTIYSVLEAYAWSKHASVFSTFLKEVQWRLFTTVIILLLAVGIIKDFNLFIKLYVFGYPCIALTLFIWLIVNKKIHFTFKVSKVSRRYFKHIVALCTFFYGGTFIFTLSQVFDTFVIASVLEKGIDLAGVFGFATVITSIIQAPQRGIVAASLPHLSKAWKDKNLPLIQRIYQRSSINQLIFACGIFLLIWMNYTDAIKTFGIKTTYLEGAWVFFLLGLTKIIDMGTGVNAQIIATSTKWRFELISGIFLLIIMLPLTYIFTKRLGVTGPAIATLISITIYNAIRIIFLWKKFRLFPFTLQTLITIILAAVCYAICYFAFNKMQGFAGMFIRSLSFIVLYAAGTILLKLTPDIKPVINTVLERLGKKKS